MDLHPPTRARASSWPTGEGVSLRATGLPGSIAGVGLSGMRVCSGSGALPVRPRSRSEPSLAERRIGRATTAPVRDEKRQGPAPTLPTHRPTQGWSVTARTPVSLFGARQGQDDMALDIHDPDLDASRAESKSNRRGSGSSVLLPGKVSGHERSITRRDSEDSDAGPAQPLHAPVAALPALPALPAPPALAAPMAGAHGGGRADMLSWAIGCAVGVGTCGLVAGLSALYYLSMAKNNK